MEKEISSGTMLGIVLIALAAVIGLGFSVFSIAKGVANEGTVGVQDNLNTVTDSAYEDYNDKIVTGTQVKSALQNFKGKSVAILINTTAMNKEVKTYSTHDTAYVRKVGTKDYINYNAILAEADSTNANALPKGTATKGTSIKGKGTIIASEDGKNTGAAISEGVLKIAASFATDENGKVVLDNTIGGQSRTGNCEYISSNAKFEANLIKDASGVNVGVIFTQMEV